MAERAAAALGAGFGALKLHCSGGVLEAVRQARALREAAGDGVELSLDVHNTLRVDEALALGRGLERLRYRFLEAPTDPEDEAGLRVLAHSLDLPIAYGEGERTRWQFRDRLVAGAVDVVQPDVGYTGVSELRRIAQLAEAFHVPCAPHLSAGLGVCIAAAVHPPGDAQSVPSGAQPPQLRPRERPAPAPAHPARRPLRPPGRPRPGGGAGRGGPGPLPPAVR